MFIGDITPLRVNVKAFQPTSDSWTSIVISDLTSAHSEREVPVQVIIDQGNFDVIGRYHNTITSSPFRLKTLNPYYLTSRLKRKVSRVLKSNSSYRGHIWASLKCTHMSWRQS